MDILVTGASLGLLGVPASLGEEALAERLGLLYAFKGYVAIPMQSARCTRRAMDDVPNAYQHKVAEQVRYRNRAIVGYFAFFYLFVSIMLLVGAIVGHPLAGRLLSASGLAVVVFALVRIFRSGVVVTPRDLRVRGFIRTKAFSWNQVVGFSTKRTRSVSGGVFVSVRLTDGRQIVTQALTGRSADSEFVLATLQGLEAARLSAGHVAGA